MPTIRPLHRLLLPSLLLLSLSSESSAQHEIGYVPVGDSYTIGQNVYGRERWPNQLAARLASKGIALKILDNPARSGWTSYEAIKDELPRVRELKPGFVTVLLGANDWVQGVSEDLFRKRMQTLVSRLEEALLPGGKILLVTIPDFSKTRGGAGFGRDRDVSRGLERFNKIIKEIGQDAGVPVADIFELSQKLSPQAGMVSDDQLHPSGEQYARWVDVIAPAAERLLRGSSGGAQ